MGPEVDQAGPRQRVVGHQVGGGTGEQDLAVMSELAEPARTGDGVAEVADLVQQLGFPGAHAYPQGGQPLCPQLALCVEGASDRL